MSLSRKRSRQRATFAGALIGLIIIFTFVITLVVPDLGIRRNDGSSADWQPIGTRTPTPLVIPTPDPDPQLAGAPPYIHSSGTFQTFRPAGTDWFIDEGTPGDGDPILRVVIQSARRLVVIHNYIQPGVEYESLDSLNENFLNAEHFAAAWGEYDRWTETRREVVSDSVLVDFDLIADGNDYLGRTLYRLEDDRLFVTRLVVPANNPALLDLLQELAAPAFVSYPDLLALPADWPAIIDQTLGYVIKHPPAWTRVAGSPGLPVTLKPDPDRPLPLIRVEAVPDTPLTSAGEAEAWVRAAEPDAAILASAPLARTTGDGYQVAYTYLDEKGNPHAALAALLNDAAGTLFAATLRIDAADANLLDPEGLATQDADARRALAEGFIVLPPEAREARSAAE